MFLTERALIQLGYGSGMPAIRKSDTIHRVGTNGEQSQMKSYIARANDWLPMQALRFSLQWERVANAWQRAQGNRICAAFLNPSP